jgi:hypothetical protein
VPSQTAALLKKSFFSKASFFAHAAQGLFA